MSIQQGSYFTGLLFRSHRERLLLPGCFPEYKRHKKQPPWKIVPQRLFSCDGICDGLSVKIGHPYQKTSCKTCRLLIHRKGRSRQRSPIFFHTKPPFSTGLNGGFQFVKELSPKSLRNREGFWYNRRKPPREAPSWKSTPKTPAAKQWLLT